MVTMSATDAKNKIGELWDIADREPVTIERNGTPRYLVVPVGAYVAVPREEYDRLRGGAPRQSRRIGFARTVFAGADIAALLDVDLSEAMKDYL
jgi:hypothetical protein